MDPSSQNAKPSQPQSRGSAYESTRFPNTSDELGTNDNLYAGGYSRNVPPQHSHLSASSQVYRPPHIQNRMNVPK